MIRGASDHLNRLDDGPAASVHRPRLRDERGRGAHEGEMTRRFCVGVVCNLLNRLNAVASCRGLVQVEEWPS